MRESNVYTLQHSCLCYYFILLTASTAADLIKPSHSNSVTFGPVSCPAPKSTSIYQSKSTCRALLSQSPVWTLKSSSWCCRWAATYINFATYGLHTTTSSCCRAFACTSESLSKLYILKSCCVLVYLCFLSNSNLCCTFLSCSIDAF